ncbi:sodium/hydrogen exchanger [Nitrosococcus halophilus Nc 4]|uniref:Sodium/hydrogen exchanger n=1 Tax=Nitrosococcus halophilus (strain Nc4) TaxID=472759 RepID=D5C1P4_NITHN|nr:cation:proton antiporter [Nitrosococcus halophilus]ADE14677.1 sodium/hydrogen exchanger [Nitrosococcus halophilus Nc 4]
MELFYILLVLLLTTRLLGELAKRIGQPPLIGEVIAGIVLGTLAAEYPNILPKLDNITEDKVFIALTDLAIFFLMLLAGMHLRLQELAKVSGSAFFIAVGGMVVPMAVGVGLGWLLVPDSDYKQAHILFLATTLSITALPVAVRILMDLGSLHSRVGQVIVLAAFINEVLGLFLLAVLMAMINTGELPDLVSFMYLLGQALLFFMVTGVVGYFTLPFIGKFITLFRLDEINFSGLLIIALANSVLAEVLGMHFILGAFITGVLFTPSTIDEAAYEEIRRRLSGISEGFLAPLFFASIGMYLDISTITEDPIFILYFIYAAFVCKFLGAGLPAYWMGFSSRDAAAIGAGMSARGAVELIIADIALRAGLFQRPEPTPPFIENLFSAIVIMALVTTLMTPFFLKMLLGHATDKEPANQHAPNDKK